MCDDSVTIGQPPAGLQPATRPCLLCGEPVPRVGRRRYCYGRACRERAYRLRQQPDQQAVTAALTIHLKQQQRLLEHTIYSCSRCEQRFLGQRRCPDCQVWCKKLGLGGLCPDCDEPVLVGELLGEELP